MMTTRSRSKVKVSCIIQSHHEKYHQYKTKCIICLGTATESMKLYNASMCQCKGSVSVYHYECLQTMLNQICMSQDIPFECKTCKTYYTSNPTVPKHISVVNYLIWLKNVISDFYIPIVFNVIQLTVFLLQVLHLYSWIISSIDSVPVTIKLHPLTELVIVTCTWILTGTENHHDYTFMGVWKTSQFTNGIALYSGAFSLIYFTLINLLEINILEEKFGHVMKVIFLTLLRRMIYLTFSIILCIVCNMIKDRLGKSTVKNHVESPNIKSVIKIETIVSPFDPSNYVVSKDTCEQIAIRCELTEILE